MISIPYELPHQFTGTYNRNRIKYMAFKSSNVLTAIMLLKNKLNQPHKVHVDKIVVC